MRKPDRCALTDARYHDFFHFAHFKQWIYRHAAIFTATIAICCAQSNVVDRTVGVGAGRAFVCVAT
jgi:hypothetical protein